MSQAKITTKALGSPVPTPKGSKRSHETIHYITVKGIYSASGGEQGRLLSKPYEITFRCRDSQHKKDGALSLFKHRVGPRVLAAHDRRFVGILEHHVAFTQTQDHELPTDIKLMNRTQLMEYIQLRDLEVRSDLYQDLGQLQTAVEECEDDPIAFVKQQDHIATLITKRVGGTFWEDFDELNSDLFSLSDRAEDEAGVVVKINAAGDYEATLPNTGDDDNSGAKTGATPGKPTKGKKDPLRGVV